jgi:hypothetical protein
MEVEVHKAGDRAERKDPDFHFDRLPDWKKDKGQNMNSKGRREQKLQTPAGFAFLNL